MDRLHHWIPCAEIGGCEIALLTLMRATPSISHCVLTNTDGPAVALWRSAGAEVRYVELGDESVRTWSRRCRESLLRERPERMICWSPARFPWLHAAMSEAGVKQAIVHLGTNIPLPWKSDWLYRLLGLLWRPSTRVSLICCSDAVRQQVASGICFRQFPAQVVLNGVRQEFFAAQVAKPGSPALIAVGRLESLKGHSTMIAAMPEILRHHPTATLTIVGEGAERERLSAQIQRLGLGGSVRLAGNRAGLPALLADSGVFIFGSNASEGMGIALAEAMAVGLPCVVSSTPALHSVAADAAEYFDCGDAGSLAQGVLRVLDSPAQATRLATAARELALREFSPTSFASAYMRRLGFPL